MSIFNFGGRKRFGGLLETILKQRAIHLEETFDRTYFSKIGSTPDLPKALEWPEWNGKSLAFLLQLKFSEINPNGAIPLMPTSGLLYIFYDQEQQTWGFDPKDKGSWRVLYFEDENEPLKMRRYPKDITVRYKPEMMLAPKIITTYLPADSDIVISHFPEDKDYEKYEELTASVYEELPAHQLGGYPLPIQSRDMDLDCQLTSNGIFTGDGPDYEDPRSKELEPGRTDWTLLLQIDSDEETFMWGDCGMLYFWIKKEDLSNLKFDDVWMILQCY
jgi:uncharacterized protein YwqG